MRTLPFAVTGFVTPRIVSSPSTSALPSSAIADLGRAELDRRRLGGVEELRREQVALELGDRGLDRLDLRRADKRAVLELGVDLLELPSELRDAVVLDDEPERAVHRVDVEGSGGYLIGRSSVLIACLLDLVGVETVDMATRVAD